MKASDELQERGSTRETEPENKQFFFFNDTYIIFTLSDIMVISSHFLNYVFALLLLQ